MLRTVREQSQYLSIHIYGSLSDGRSLLRIHLETPMSRTSLQLQSQMIYTIHVRHYLYFKISLLTVFPS
jgi:hypothetical protein